MPLAKRPVKKSSSKQGLIRKSAGMNRLTMSLVAAVTVVSGITAVAVSQASTINPVTITSPAAGAQVKGVVAVSAKENPVNTTSKANLLVDGKAATLSNDCVYAQIYQPGAYNVCWNTNSVADGTHSLVFKITHSSGTVLLSAARSVKVANNPAPAYFKMIYPPYADTFIFKLTDPARIAEARTLIGKQKIVNGIISTTPASYNSPWHFQLDPATITFADTAAEVCDSDIRYVEDNLATVGSDFLPDNRWCPWGSKILSEVAAPPIRYTQEFETGLDGWTPRHYLECETSKSYNCSTWPLIWAINRTTNQAHAGKYSLKYDLNGLHDDGTIWMEKQFTAKPNATVVATLSFYVWSKEQSDMNNFYVAGYLGKYRPTTEEEFTVLGYTNQVAGWKKYTVQKNVQTDATGKVWAGFGISAVYEAIRTYNLDSVSVSIN